jgi:hypothetical protein
VSHEIEDDRGPALVTVEYRIDPAKRRDQNQKNTTDPKTLTMDRALQLFGALRSIGARQK